MSIFKDIYEKAVENNWSEEELAKALEEAKINSNEISGLTALSLDEMSAVSGGADDGTCKHPRLERCKGYDISPGKNDWGYHVVKGWKFECLDCHQKWFNTDPNWRP